MENYSLLLNSIEFKVRQIIDIRNQLLTKLEETRKQLLKLEEENKKLKERIAKLEYENILSQSKLYLSSAGKTQKFKRLLDQAIKEIDTTIAYLTKD